MVDGSVRFSDVLGGRIASFALTRDQKLTPPGQAFVEEGRWGGLNTFERLLEMHQDDVVVRVCVRAVVTEDGVVVKFDG